MMTVKKIPHFYFTIEREGSGMSAWGIIALILGVVGGGTAAWFCYMVKNQYFILE